MPKINYTFNIPEELEEFNHTHQWLDYFCILWELLEHFKREGENGNKNLTAWDVHDKILGEINSRNLKGF